MSCVGVQMMVGVWVGVVCGDADDGVCVCVCVCVLEKERMCVCVLFIPFPVGVCMY